MKIKNKVPMYIAVQLENGDKRVWLPLPAKKEKFAATLEKIDGEYGNFKIKVYNCRIPAMGRGILMKTPLSVVNYFAARLNKLTDDEIVKLCAICDSDYYFDRVGQFIDYTFQTHCYTLLSGITDEEALGMYYIGDPKQYIAGVVLKQYIDRREHGRRVAEAESGVFTAHGYLTSSIGWDLPPKERCVPDSLNLKGLIGEELYDDWNDYDIGA